MRGIPLTERLFIGGDFNGHTGATKRRYDDVHAGFGFGDRKGNIAALLEFKRAFGLVVDNSSFSEEHFLAFYSMVAKTRIDFLLLRKADRSLYKHCKVVSSENLTTQHKLLVTDLEKEGEGCGWSRIKRGSSTMVSAPDIGISRCLCGLEGVVGMETVCG